MKQEIRKLLGTEKLLIGTERTVKELRTGSLQKVILAENCPDAERQEIERLAGLVDVAIESAGVDNEELGVLCKKPFRIAVLGIKA